MVCTDQELWWWIREGRCALKQSLNRILDDERKGTSNVIFIVPSRSDLFCSTWFPTVVLHLSRWGWGPVTSGLPEIQHPAPGQQTWDSRATWGVWSHQVGLGLGLSWVAPGGCAQNSRPGGSGMSELLTNSSGLKVGVQLEIAQLMEGFAFRLHSLVSANKRWAQNQSV